MVALYVLVIGGITGAWLDLFHQHIAPAPPIACYQHDVRVVVLSSARLFAAPAIACSFQLVIVDIDNGDGTDPLALCRRLRTLYQGALLLISGNMDENYIQEAYAAGVDECIAKPVDLLQLRAKLISWLERIHNAGNLSDRQGNM